MRSRYRSASEPASAGRAVAVVCFRPIDSVIQVHLFGAPHLSAALYLWVHSCYTDGRVRTGECEHMNIYFFTLPLLTGRFREMDSDVLHRM